LQVFVFLQAFPLKPCTHLSSPPYVLHALPISAIFLDYTTYTRWFKYDRDDLCVNKSQFVPVIFEPPCTSSQNFRLCRGAVEEFVFLDVAPPKLINFHRRFGTTYRPIFKKKMGMLRYPETSLTNYQSRPRSIS
jgi:hypothetical protein